MTSKRDTIFGLPLDLMTLDETVRVISGYLAGGGVCRHVVLNVPKVLQAQQDDILASAIRSATLVNADGTWIAVGARFCGVRVPERFTGYDLMQVLVSRAASSGDSVYFLGATEDVLEKVVERYRSAFPGLSIAGYCNGYFSDEESQGIADQIRESRAVLLFIGIPSPRKELWLAEFLEHTGATFGMGVGGSFDVVAGQIKRAPVWVQQSGFEWLYRLIQEPRKMWRRYLLSIPGFTSLVFNERLSRWLRRRSSA